MRSERGAVYVASTSTSTSTLGSRTIPARHFVAGQLVAKISLLGQFVAGTIGRRTGRRTVRREDFS